MNVCRGTHMLLTDSKKVQWGTEGEKHSKGFGKWSGGEGIGELGAIGQGAKGKN